MVNPTMVGFPIVFVSSPIVIACIVNAFNLIGYLCAIGRQCHRYILMAGLISSHTSSTLLASPNSRVFTLGSL